MQASVCVRCKGSNPRICDREFCPIYSSHSVKQKILEKIDKDFYGCSPPSVFVGSKLKYPQVNIGILSPLAGKEEAWKYDSVNYWYENKCTIQDVVQYRSGLINSRFQAEVFDARNSGKLLELTQEVGMSLKCVDLEVNLKKKLRGRTNFNSVVLPFGPTGEVKDVKAQENIKVNNKVDKVFSDKDMKAVEGVKYLWKSGLDEYQLTQLLSIGSMGLGKNRKLVSTRSSITAVDDMLGKEIIEEVKNFPLLNNYILFYGNYFGNYFLIMFFPSNWGFDLFEGYMPRSIWNPSESIVVENDYEGFYGRKEYAFNTAGGYYANRFPVLEFLKSIKRQGGVFSFRAETPEYSAPLGVFVVRQGVKKTLSGRFERFDSSEKMLLRGKEIIWNDFKYDLSECYAKSRLLKSFEQKKLFEY